MLTSSLAGIEDNDNIGIIVGTVMTGLLVAIIIATILLILLIKKKRKLVKEMRVLQNQNSEACLR